MSGSHAPSDLVAPGLVRILNDEGEHRGFGLLVADGKVVTCAHVVALAWDEPHTLETPLDRPVTLVFPFLADEIRVGAAVAVWVPMEVDGAGDVAGLVLTGTPPDGARPVRMARGEESAGHDILVYGYQGGLHVPAWVPASIVDRTHRDRLQLGLSSRTSGLRIREGYSGSPIWDVQTGQVVGLAHSASRRKDMWLAFGLRVEQILRAWPELHRAFDRSCPYRKLVAFGPSDGPLFFGREEETRKVVDAVIGSSMCMVTGASGVGKTSLLQAAVLPELERRGFGTVVLRTLERDDPWDCVAQAVPGLPEEWRAGSLEARLAQVCDAVGRERLVLVVDQFEDLLRRDRRRTVAFAEELRRITQQRHRAGNAVARVVLIVREDDQGKVTGLPGYAETVKRTVLIGPLDADRLREVIEKPARLRGVRLEEELIQRIIDDVRYQPYALQVLQIHLVHLWERLGTDDELRLRDYDEVVRAGGELADHFESVWNSLAADERRAAQELFLHLAVPLDSGAFARRTAERNELDPALWEIAGVLATLSLVVLRGPDTDATAELVHDSLIDQWPWLRKWLTSQRELLAWRMEVRGRLRDWTEAGRPTRHLLTGAVLERGKALHPHLNPLERDLVATSLKRRALLLRLAAVLIALVVLIVCLTVSIYADQLDQTRRQTDLAAARRLAAASGELTDADPGLARLLAVAAWRLAPVGEARQAMVRALGNPWRATLRGHRDTVRALAFTPDGARLATASDDDTIRLWDVSGQNETDLLTPRGDGAPSKVVVSPDGRTLVTAETSGAVRLWSAATGLPLDIEPLPDAPPWTRGFLWGHTQAVLAADFEPDSTVLATAGGDRTVRFWDTAVRRPIGRPLTGFKGAVNALAYAPDGRSFVTGDLNGDLAFWRTADRRRLHTFGFGDFAGIYSLAFTRDGSHLFASRWDGVIVMMDARKREIIRTWPLPAGSPVLSLAVDSARNLLMSGSADGVIRMWDVENSEPIGPELTGHGGPVWTLALSPDGRTLASGGADATVRLWDLPDRTLPPPLPWPGGQVTALAFARGSRSLAVTGRNHDVALVDPATRHVADPPPTGLDAIAVAAAFDPAGTALTVLDGLGIVHTWDTALRRTAVPLSRLHRPRGRSSGAFSKDVRTAATGHEDGVIRLWDTASGRLAGELRGHLSDSFVYGVVFAPDSRYLASASVDGTARLWDLSTGSQIGAPMADLLGGVYSAAFSPDGRTLAVGAGDGSVRFWEVPGLARIGPTIRAHSGPVWSLSFSPDNLMIASAGADGRIWVWDRATRRPLAGPFAVPRPALPVVAFDPDSRLLAVGDQDAARIWPVGALTDLPERLCAAAGRSLTPAEWRRFLPAGPSYRKVCPEKS